MIENQPLHLVWITIVLINLIIQLAYFFRDGNSLLYLGKRITTPLLLLGAMVLVLLSSPPLSILTLVILSLMGLGEIGIEGSSVVEKRAMNENARKLETLKVTLAGILFLLVNLILGIALLAGMSFWLIASMLGISLALYGMMNFTFALIFDLDGESKFQTRVYSAGLVVLLAGALGDIRNGLSQLGLAALILSLSDTLVLIRMAAGFDKQSRKGYVVTLIFLVIILLLYYFYMAILIHRSNPF